MLDESGQQTLHGIATVALNDAGGNYQDAVALLKKRTWRLRWAREQLLEAGLKATIRSVALQDRRKTIEEIREGAAARGKEIAAKSAIKTSRRAIGALIRRGAFSLLLPGGIRLGDSTFRRVVEAQEALLKQRNGIQRSISIYAVVLNRVPKDLEILVRSVWTEDELNEQLGKLLNR